MCPHFMGYDEKIIHCLEEKYEVTYINTEQFLSVKRKLYTDKSLVVKGFLKSLPALREKYREKLLKECDVDYIKILNEINYDSFDIILVINGDGVSNMVYEHIKSNNPNAELVLYIWDDLHGLFKTNHLKYFDRIVSYNIEDCKKNGFIYTPMFTERYDFDCLPEKKYDIAIIATANDKRVRFAKELYDKYKYKYKFFIYFYCESEGFDFFINKDPLDFSEYMTKIAESKAVLEVVRHHQMGPTTRIFDSIVTKTKVITTNNHIVKYPVFSENILVLDTNNDIPSSFIDEEFKEISYSPLFIEEWIKTLLQK